MQLASFILLLLPCDAALLRSMAVAARRTGGVSFVSPLQFRIIAPPVLRLGGNDGEEKKLRSPTAADPTEEMDLATKGVWFATEAFGKMAAVLRGNKDEETAAEAATSARKPASLAEAVARLEADYKGTDTDPRPYFLTGKMDVSLYDADCEFADPFVSFNGRDRFVENLENLAGGFITESSTRTLSSSVDEGDPADPQRPPQYTTKLLVKLRLGLPWQPVLAWPWGVTHVFDRETGLIVRHLESWDVSAAEGVRQLFTSGEAKRV